MTSTRNHHGQPASRPCSIRPRLAPPLMATALFLACALFPVVAIAETPTTAPATNPAADVSLIAAWLTGSDAAAGTFSRPFGDAPWLTKAKDAILYTDVGGVTVPQCLRAVPYDFLKPRMDLLHGGHQLDPAVVITRSVAGEPKEAGTAAKVAIRQARPGERCYYIEVGIGNMAWWWMKIALYDVDGKTKAEFLWSMVS